MTSDPIRAAIEQLRASIEALPEFAKREQWRADKRHHSVNVLSGDPDAAWSVQMIAHIGSDRAPAHLPIGEHIALTASPHVTEALIALLTAIDDVDLPDALDAREIEPDGLRQIQSASAALATAITRRPE